MGFTLSMFETHGASTQRKANPKSNGVTLVKPGERKLLTVDFQNTNTLLGDISIQGVSNVDTDVKIYYTNCADKISGEYGFTALDPDMLQGNDPDKTLWFKYTKSFSLVAQTPKHEQFALPICRWVTLVIENTSSEEMIICIHFLHV